MAANALPVVLLHGLGRSPASMRPLAWRLGRRGLRALRPAYASTALTVTGALEAVRRWLARIDGPFHMVGHSLGGLIAGRLLREGGLAIGRVVQMGAPNLGSPVAARMGGRWPLTRLCGPALAELGPHDEVPAVRPEIGAIAGAWGPTLPGRLERPHDGAVSQRSAWAGAGHKATVPVVHTLLPASPAAARLTHAFLTTGSFPETP